MSGATASDLTSVPLFTSLSDDERGEVADWFDARDVGANTRLVGEGTTGMAFFVLVEGDVAVTTSEGTTTMLGPGDFFGEVALLTGGRRTATVTTMSPVRVLVLVGDDFRRLAEAYPGVGAEIDATGQARLRARSH